VNSNTTGNSPFFSIVIPTRERHDTLYYAIESALNQDFDDFEVVIMDNFSSPETVKTVDQFESDKICYFRSDKRLAMHDNWELGLSHCRGHYMFFLGDDDALLPDALHLASKLISSNNSKLVCWRKPTYWWSSAIVPRRRDRLFIPLSQNMAIVDSKQKLQEYYQFKIPYDNLPGIYNTFVHHSIIDQAKNRLGRYFITPSPDVCSSIINAYYSDQYLYSERGLSLSGNSGHSTGCSIIWPNHCSAATKLFKKEQEPDSVIHPMLIESDNIQILLASEMLKTKETLFPDDDRFVVSADNLINSMASSLKINPGLYEQTVSDIRAVAEKNSVKIDLTLLPEKTVERAGDTQGFMPDEQLGTLAINCEQADVLDAAHAARLVQSLYPAWQT